ncbi:methyltransferase domain-containing protein [Cupriavidus gilardii]|uniref:tRNA (guanine(46)-N(7))-methyltransferase TrmB n=1 Tax=Cupriavidus gilardii TaxID=82541 RepID=UPI0021C1E518|nr:methyltransferase domain-containing protein [Cupriavidus gilardii]MCT9114829.1 methyltransferase domain-containing protein [Cupriavidus gilardii]
MFANSRPIASAQTDAHQQLATRVARHLAEPFRKPIGEVSRGALDAALASWQAAGGAPLILDAGCGVGESTLRLAQAHPDHFVIGVDQSEKRLTAGKDWWQGALPDNFVWARADLVDVWRLLQRDRIAVARHYVLYPNPWPKIGHLGRRWHGHAVFPALAACGDYLECRSNWPVYIDEFAQALALVGRPARTEPWHPEQPMTPFERKYRASGHPLWRCVSEGPAPQ